MTILVHHVGALGDSLITIPALRAVRAEWPRARIVMLHDATSRDAAARSAPRAVFESSGLVDAFEPYVRHLSAPDLVRELARVWWTVRRLAPSAAVFVGPSARAASALRRDRALFWSAGVRRLHGFHPCDAALGGGGVQRGAGHEAVRKLQRLARDGITRAGDTQWLRLPLIDPAPDDRNAVDAWLRDSHAPLDRLVAIGPETAMPAKLWPEDRFVELGTRLVRAGWCPVLVGSGDGPGAARGWVDRWGPGFDAAGRWPVPATAALLARCRAYVGVDSGVAHLAAAVGCRAVVLTSGRADLDQWSPLGSGHVVLRHRTPCEGCAAVECPEPGHPCMTAITVDEAWAATLRVLDADDVPSGEPADRDDAVGELT